MRAVTGFMISAAFGLMSCTGPAEPPEVSTPLAAGYLLPAGSRLVLRGSVLAADGAIEHGYVALANGRILSVADKPPDDADAVTINTQAIILPGFVDLHNHVPWNVLPRWIPSHTYANHSEWTTDPQYLLAIEGPFNHLVSSYFCDMNAWGELRALVGGTTSILATRRQPCIHGLLRNLDYNSGFYGTTELDREHVFNVLGLPPASNVAARTAFVTAARSLLGDPRYEALVTHLAEGTDALAEEEFTFVQSQELLASKVVLIHGVSLSPADFQAMATAGVALVWSPHSNLGLYGATANIGAALDAGVDVALAPDWAITGSSNMLDELKTADAWNRQHLGGRLSDRQLVDMVTAIPARLAGIEDEVGTLSPGLRADLVVIDGDQDDPWRAVIDATPANVDLVVIDGIPLYGERRLMERFWKPVQLEDVVVEGVHRSLATAAAGVVVADVAGRLNPALQQEGTSLAPLAEH